MIGKKKTILQSINCRKIKVDKVDNGYLADWYKRISESDPVWPPPTRLLPLTSQNFWLSDHQICLSHVNDDYTDSFLASSLLIYGKIIFRSPEKENIWLFIKVFVRFSKIQKYRTMKNWKKKIVREDHIL